MENHCSVALQGLFNFHGETPDIDLVSGFLLISVDQHLGHQVAEIEVLLLGIGRKMRLVELGSLC
jgi:hypothetical protein